MNLLISRLHWFALDFPNETSEPRTHDTRLGNQEVPSAP